MQVIPTPTSGGAAIQRFEVVDCIDDKHVPAVIPEPHGPWVRYEDHIAALAAGQATAAPTQPAAQPGAAYAALPAKYYLAGGEVPTWDEKQMHAFADATCALRAARGQAPATAQADTVLYDPKAVLEIFNSARNGSDKPVGYMRGILAVIAHWESRPEPHRWMVPVKAADSVLEDAAQQPRLKVRLTAFPESNGKQNWTALLVRADKWGGLVGNCGGISLARGELWNRVAYEAERARFLIGERDTEPFILDYGDDIKTPEEWKGEVYGGRKSSGAARKQGGSHD